MRTLLVSIMTVFMLAATAAAEPPPLDSWSVTPPEELEDYSITAEEASASYEQERDELIRYYSQRMETVEGVVADINTETMIMTIQTAEGDIVFAYDEDTKFQVLLREIPPEQVKVGSKMAGLYRLAHNVPYLGRVVIMSKATGKRRRRRR